MTHARRPDPLEIHKASHSPAAIRQRLQAGPVHSYVRDFVYGAIDGTVTTFAVVSGVAGAGLSSGIVIVFGLANLLGDGFSMAASNFLGTRAEQQQIEKARREEQLHIALYPEGEREEIRQIFIQKGFAGEDLEKAVKIITSDLQQWVDTMLKDELGMPLERPSAWRAALSTFAAFVGMGLFPLLAFIGHYWAPSAVTNPYPLSAWVTGVAFVATGAAKGRFVGRAWIWSGLETVGLGGAAAGVAYAVGMLLRGVAG